MTTRLSGPPRCTRLPVTLCAIAERASDGKQIIFTALDPVKGPGTELARFATSPGENYSWDFSPDGTHIAVARQPRRRFAILPLDGRATKDVVTRTGIDSRTAEGRSEGVDIAWAADGKGLFTAGRTPQKSVLLYIDLRGDAHVVREQNGGLPPIVKTGFFGPWGVPSQDGRHLALLNLSRNSKV